MVTGGLRTVLLLAAAAWVGCLQGVSVQANSASLADEQSASREDALYQRYLQILLRSPRPGTAFDKVFEYHRDRRSLDQFADELKPPDGQQNDAARSIVLGLVYQQQQKYAEAAAAFKTATAIEAGNAVAFRLLGEAQLAAEDFDNAAQSLEQALELTASKPEQLTIFQTLGRLYQQSRQLDHAVKVYRRLEDAFPRDERILESVADVLQSAGLLEEALERFQRLEGLASSPQQSIEFSLQAAALEVQLDRHSAARKRLTELSRRVRPGSYLYGRIVEQIEQSYLQQSDLAGLIEYHNDSLQRDPSDVGTMSRLASALLLANQADRAEAVLLKAVELAPEDRDLRERLIQILLGRNNVAAAIEQYQQLAQLTELSFEQRAAWGRLVLRNDELSAQEQKSQTLDVWQPLLDEALSDPTSAVRLASLLRSAGFVEEALQAYRTAVELAPGDAQFHEYLGEFLHSQNRPEEAVAAWQQMAAGERESADSLENLVQVLERFGYADRALQVMPALLRRQPTVEHYLSYARMLKEAGRFDDALRQIDRAAALPDASRGRRLSEIAAARISVLRDGGRLRNAAADLRRHLQDSSATTADDWHTLAMYYEAIGDLAAASDAIRNALQRANDVEILKSAMQIFERAGALNQAADVAERLVDRDAAFRSVHLKTLLRLQADLGQRDRIAETAKRLIAAAPDNDDNYQFAADLLLRLGDLKTAVDLLERATSGPDAGPELLRQYADTLNTLFRTDEAIAAYWRLFDQSQDVQQKLVVVRQLAQVYHRANRFDELKKRLQAAVQTSDSSQQPDARQILAAALLEGDQPDAARQVLLQATQQQPNNAALWEQLAGVAEQQNDLAAAADYQRRVTELNPSVQATDQLARFAQQAGQLSAGEADWLKYSHNGRAPAEVLAFIDRRLSEKDLSLAAKLIDDRLQSSPDNWELLLRRAVVEWLNQEPQQLRSTVELLLQQDIAKESSAWQSVLNRSATPQSDEAVVVRLDRRLQQMAAFISKKQIEEGVPWAAADVEEARAVALLLAVGAAPDDVDFGAFQNSIVSNQSKLDWSPLLTAKAWNLLQSEPVSLIEWAKETATDGSLEQQFAVLFEAARQPEAMASEDAAKVMQIWNDVARQQPEWLLSLANVPQLLDRLQAFDDDRVAKLRQDLLRPGASAAELQIALADAMQQSSLAAIVDAAVRLNEFPSQQERLATRLSSAAWLAARAGDVEVADRIVQTFLQEKSRVVPPRTEVSDLQFSVSTNFRLHHGQNRPVVRRDTSLAFDEHWPRRDVEFLVNAREAFRGLTGLKLTEKIRAIRDGSDGYPRYIASTALAHLAFLDGDNALALQHLVQAAADWPNDDWLRLRLAEHYHRQGYSADALRLLDTTRGDASDLIAAREFLALEIAGSVRNLQRAQQAADQLLGLRLPPEQTTRLRQLLNEADLEEFVQQLETRSFRFNDDLSRLVGLMDDAVAEAKTAVAAEVAFEILETTQGLTRGPKNGRSLPAIRADAIRAIQSAGQIDRFLKSIDASLQVRPDDVRLMQSKLEVLTALGQNDQAAAVRQRLEQVQPLSVDRLLQQAEEFERVRNHRAASDLLLQVLQQDPQRFSGNYYQYLKTFAQAGRTVDLADTLMQHDLRKLQNNHYVVNEVVQALFAEAKRQGGDNAAADKGLQLFEAAWKAFPTNRTFLLTEVDDERIWQLPLMLDYARTAFIPQSVQQAAANPWKVITGRLQPIDGSHVGVGRDGRFRVVEATMTRFVRAMIAQDRVAEFRSLTAEAVEDYPLWHGGQLLLAVLDSLDGDHHAAASTFNRLTAQTDSMPVPPDAALLAVQEIRFDVPETLQQAVVDLLSKSIREDPSPQDRPYRNTAGSVLVEWLARLGQPEAARTTAAATLQQIDFQSLAGDGSVDLTRANQLVDAANQLTRLKQPLAAAQLLNEDSLLVDESVLQLDRNTRSQLNELRRRLRSAVSDDELLRWLTPVPGQETDLLLYVDRDGRLQSFVVDRLQERFARDAAWADRLKQFLDDPVAGPAVVAATAAVAHAMNHQHLLTAAMDRLQKSGDGSSPTSSAGDEKDRPLEVAAAWLAVRHRLSGSPAKWERRLAEEAATAAISSGRNDWAAAILDEQGELAVRRNDRDAASQAWTELLDVVLNSPTSPAAEVDASTAPDALDLLRQTLLSDGPVQP